MRSTYIKERKKYLQTLNIDPNVDEDLLMMAFTHKSFAMDYVEDMSHHERLEFLGDAVLGSAIATLLYKHLPQVTEATLSLYKIALVREETLALVAKNIELNKHILLSKGEEGSGGRDKLSITSDCLESLIGMISLHSGYNAAFHFVETYIFCLVDEINDFLPIKSAKSRVQEYSQKHYKKLPIYTEEPEEIDDNNNITLFRSTLVIDTNKVVSAVGSSKKKAQEAAAVIFLSTITK